MASRTRPEKITHLVIVQFHHLERERWKSLVRDRNQARFGRNRFARRPVDGIALLAMQARGTGERDRQFRLLLDGEAVDDGSKVAVQLGPAADFRIPLGLSSGAADAV